MPCLEIIFPSWSVGLTTTGLTLDIAGVALMFFFSPALAFRSEDANSVTVEGPIHTTIEGRKARCRYRAGLLLLIVGFACQLAASYA